MPGATGNSGISDNHTRGSVAGSLGAKSRVGSRVSVVSAYFAIYWFDELWNDPETVADVKQEVLLLSATPVNNDLRDFRNQIYFLTDGEDAAFKESIGAKPLPLYQTYSGAPFSQADREKCLVGMMKVNFLKRLESSVESFQITMGRTIAKIEDLERKIWNYRAAPGVVFCLKQKGEPKSGDTVNPLQPYYLVCVRDDGTVRFSFVQPKQILEIYRLLCSGKATAYEQLCQWFDTETNDGADMALYNRLLAAAVIPSPRHSRGVSPPACNPAAISSSRTSRSSGAKPRTSN